MTEPNLNPRSFDHEALARQVLEENDILYSKISQHCGVPRQTVPAALTEVIRFLSLIAWCNQTLTPSKFVDDVWHEFILCTKAYMDFCQRHFNRMIHHYPGGTREKNKAQFERTLALYETHFGLPAPQFWRKSGMKAPDAACGTCESFNQ